MKNKIIFLAKAKSDLNVAADWLRLHSTLDNAFSIVAAIISRVGILKDFPDIGLSFPDDLLNKYGYRMLILEKYAVIYRHIKDTIYIYRIFDTRTNYVKVFKDFASFKKNLLHEQILEYHP